MSKPIEQTCDVLIVGGGPTGVTLGVLLARRGVKVIVAEKEADIYPLPRAGHIDHEGMRILQEAGVAEAVMPASLMSGLVRGVSVKFITEGDADPQSFIPRMIDWYKAGKFPFDRLIKTFPFDQINEAAHASEAGAAIKPVLLLD